MLCRQTPAGSLSQPKSDLSDFGHSIVTNSGKPEFVWVGLSHMTESVGRSNNVLRDSCAGSRVSFHSAVKLAQTA